jgi:hypothetical protein
MHVLALCATNEPSYSLDSAAAERNGPGPPSRMTRRASDRARWPHGRGRRRRVESQRRGRRLSDLFFAGDDEDDVWDGPLADGAAHHPALPVVGYEARRGTRRGSTARLREHPPCARLAAHGLRHAGNRRETAASPVLESQGPLRRTATPTVPAT